MPKPAPVLTAGSRAPRRPTRIPPAVRLACQFLVEGAPGDDATSAPLGFVEAAKLAGVRPDAMRRWLDVPAVRSLIKAKRAAFRESLCASNELALAAVRDRSRNDMAKVRAVIALEEIHNAADAGRAPPSEGPRLSINIVDRLEQPPAVTIKGRAMPAARSVAPYAPAELESNEPPPEPPIFRPPRP